MVTEKIGLWQKSLLDLGKRNRLLSYKNTKRSNIKIVEPELSELYQKIVIDETSLKFPHPINEKYVDGEESLEKVSDGELLTDRTIADQQRTLRMLREKGRTFIQEQGINVLYLTFGFLKWKEDFKSDVWIVSPIVLVPAKLTIESISDPYVLSLHEDEIVVNPTLKYKLENDFGIDIPDFSEFDENIEGYLNLVQSEIADKNGWAVDKRTDLSALSFLKINMYTDLKNNEEKIKENPILKALLGDHSGVTRISEELDGYDHDSKTIPTDTYQVVDADSSQQDAVLYSKNSASFILQGPPGTGKSQTITNIIAESLADGKKVLFVAEKMAALDVVYNRLSKVSLGDFCLPLHSHKANKKDILQQLNATLQLTKSKVQDDAYYLLDSLVDKRSELNTYIKDLHTNNLPLNKSIYQINGELAKLSSVDDIVFKIDSVEKFDKEKLNENIRLLSNMVNSINVMKEDYSTNPWKGCNVKSVSHELRHFFESEIPTLVNELTIVLASYNELNKNIDSSILPSLAQCNNLVADLDRIIHMAENNTIHIEWLGLSDIEKTLRETEVLYKKQEVYQTTSDLLYAKYENKYFGIEKAGLWTTIVYELTQEIRNKYREIGDIKKDINEKYKQDIYGIKHDLYLELFTSVYTGIFKMFKKHYGKSKKLFQQLSLMDGAKKSDEEIIDVLNKLMNLYNLESWIKEAKSDIVALNNLDNYEKEIVLKKSEYSNLYLDLYEGLNTNWKNVIDKLKWAKELLLLDSKYTFAQEFLIKVCESNLEIVKTSNKELRNNILTSNKRWQSYVSYFDNIDLLEQMHLEDLISKVDMCRQGLSFLEEWVDYKRHRKVCYDNDLGECIEKAEELNILKTQLVNVYLKHFYKLWLDKITANYTSMMSFRGRRHEEVIQEFRNLDKTQLDIAKGRIYEKLVQSLPDLNRTTYAQDEIGILKRELNKKRRIMPIRRLFKEIPNLLMVLKPCLMMSPLSVSLFLQANAYEFDIVIFDEASQVKTEDAVGAIMRGKQVIICGDNNQLPPTNFFGATLSGEDYDNEDDESSDIGAFESVLDESLTFLPERTLKWHYRSKHEHLIAFSNAKIYKHSLITFPSSFEKVPNNGVEYVYVKNGIYDKGKSNTNIIEAKRIAELVFEHIKEQPLRSLGVVTFSAKQQTAVENEIRQLRIQNQEYEDFFNEEKEEAFFVKNLENVQGDERDTIMFSIGYAKDGTGKPLAISTLNTLTRAGSHRRLNVAITRAKYNIKLIGSILPTDIDLSRTSSEGVHLLRSYIDFAINGVSVLDNEITSDDNDNTDSPFEDSVLDFLRNNGYQVATQVGCSGYKIDLAVKHPTLNGRFVLGVECDGATYHSARTARERDRIRQTVLEDIGWKIYRIWSTDWIKDPITEGEKLLKRVERSIDEYKEEYTQQSTEISKKKEDSNPFIELIEEDIDEDASNIYNFEDYEIADIDSITRVYPDLEYARRIIELIVEKEAPIHFDLVCRRMVSLFGNTKVTSVVRREVKEYSRLCRRNFDIIGDYYWKKGDRTFNVKVPTDDSGFRDIQYIAKEELAEAMLIIIQHSYGISKESLLATTAREFGFKRKTKNISEHLEKAFDYLMKQKRIKIVDGKLTVNNRTE